ncbi:MAG: hypothetical protein J7621_30555 [Niastella sp.]|nr:hypothetical protein [Niastella sp.]
MRMMICNPWLFWNWFIKHHEKYKYPSKLTSKERLHWDKLLQREVYTLCFEHLFAEVICDEPASKARMIISAHGNPKKFEKLELCMEAAPHIEGWEFQAFYPPMPAEAGTRHNYPSVTTMPDEIWFSPVELIPDSGRYNIELYVHENVPVSWEIQGAATQMMFNLLGEKIGGLYVRKVSVSHLTEVARNIQQTLLPMTKLPEYIKPDDRLGMSIDPQGGFIKPGGK